MKRFVHLLIISLVFLGLAAGAPLTAEESDDDIGDVVVFATNSIQLKKNSQVLSGHVVANDQSDGPYLASGKELVVGVSATTSPGSALRADSVQVKTNAEVAGYVEYASDLTNNGSIGAVYDGLDLPVYDNLPPFEYDPPPAGAADVFLYHNDDVTLPEGDYGDIASQTNTTLTFSGGVYRVRSIDMEDGAYLYFEAPTTLIIEDKFQMQSGSYLGAAPGADVDAAEIVLYVSGVNGSTGALGGNPKSAQFGSNNEVHANVYAPYGTIYLKEGSAAVGSFLGRDVLLGIGVQVALDSAFFQANRAPTPEGDAFTVVQGGTFDSAAMGFNLMANDTDPDHEDLLTVTETPEIRPLYGAITLNADGSFIYVHDGEGTDPDYIAYEVCDNGDPVLCSATKIAVTVTEVPVNQPPVADPQDVVTAGDVNLLITLSATDPESEFLVYSLLTLPTNGALYDGAAEVTAVPYDLNGATVTYDPASADNLTDGFTFAATDPGGETGAAPLRINPDGNAQPPDSPPPPPPAGSYTVTAEDGSAETTTDTAIDITLTGEGPCEETAESGDCLQDMVLTFSIEGDCADTACASPALGSLSNLTQDPQTTPKSAVVTYTPDTGASGEDSFQFEACGEIDGVEVCERASVAVAIDQPAQDPLVTARDQSLETPEDTSLAITLTSGVVDAGTGEPIGPAYTQSATLSAVAGNVADSTGDGFGDNKSNLFYNQSGKVMGAALLSTGGGGWNGATRIHMEWNLSTITNPYVQSAVVRVSADPAGDETLDTSFYAVQQEGNGILDLTDYQAAISLYPAAALPTSVGDGEFSFDVTSQMQAVIDGGYAFFSLQGRVDESAGCAEGPCRGLQLRSSSTLNNSNPCDGLSYGPCYPTLDVSTSAFQVTFSIASLPAGGTLKDSGGNEITCTPDPGSRNLNLCQTPAPLPTSAVTYTPNPGFNGSDAFQFQVDDGVSTDTGVISLTIGDPPEPPDGCTDNGREGSCEP